MCCEPQTSLLACTQKQFASRADEITTSPICPQLSLTFRTQHCSDLRVVNRLLCVPVTSRHVRAVTARYSALGAMHLTQLRWSDLQPYTMSSVVPGTFVTRKYLHATPLQPVCLQPRAFQPAGSRCHCRRQSIAVRASKEGKDATKQAPRHPPAPLQEAAETLGGKDTTDDGRVVRGDGRPRNDGFNGRFYLNVTGFPFPLGPLFARQTVRTEVEPGLIWCFEQEQSLAGINVVTTVRMTVVKLQNGELLVYAPIAPTRECLALLAELDGPVKHILLTTHAYEHKIFVSPFQRRFRDAQVYVVPNLWSFPLNLPLPLLGIFNAKVLTSDDMDLPWSQDLSHKVLSSSIGAAPYCELALFHKKAKVLMVTDAVVYIPEDPPEVVNRDKLQRAGEDNLFVRLLYAKDKAQPVKTRDEQEKLGWKRMALLISYFAPEHLRDPVTFPIISGRLIVMPVIQTLVFAKIPGPARKWVNAMTREWDFTRVISAHFSSPVNAGPKDVRDAFRFAYDMAELGTDKAQQQRVSSEQGGSGPISWPQNLKRTSKNQSFPQQDLKGLNYIDTFIKFFRIANRKPRNDEDDDAA